MQFVYGDPLGYEVDWVRKEIVSRRKQMCEFASVVERLLPGCECKAGEKGLDKHQ